MIGASDTSMACAMTSAETCERSTRTPSRFISRTTSSPNRVSPLCIGVSVAESAQAVLWLCVSVMYRAPSRASTRSAPSEPPIDCPPSTPMSEATLPAELTRSTSSAVSANSRVSE